LSVNKVVGMTLKVAKGAVRMSSFGDQKNNKEVQKGFGGLISPKGEGSFLLSALTPEEQLKLSGEFSRIFSKEDGPNIKPSPSIRQTHIREIRREQA